VEKVNSPTDPFDKFGNYDTNAVAIHEIYASYVRAGFTSDQAMTIIIAMLKELTRGAIANPPNMG
jgi:hypothetical protein